jgi:hypothetical protein
MKKFISGLLLLSLLIWGLSPISPAIRKADAEITPYYLPWEEGNTATVSRSYSTGHDNGKIDFVINGGLGAKVVAAKSGTIVYANDLHYETYLGSGKYNNSVIIKHSEGEYSGYYHLEHDSIPTTIKSACDMTKLGSYSGNCSIQVNEGQMIGEQAMTGWSTGVHLHFETGTTMGISSGSNNLNEVINGEIPNTVYAGVIGGNPINVSFITSEGIVPVSDVAAWNDSTPALTAIHSNDASLPVINYDYNYDNVSDVWSIKERGTTNNKVEVHVMSGTDPSTWLVNREVDIEANTLNNFEYKIADYDLDGYLDLWAIKKWTPNSNNNTEVHIFSGKYDFRKDENGGKTYRFSTGLHKTDNNWSFDVKDFDGDNKPDLWGISRNPSTNKTEFHIFMSSTSFKHESNAGSVEHITTSLESTPDRDQWDLNIEDYDNDGQYDLLAVKTNAVSNNNNEIHIYYGKDSFKGDSEGGNSDHITTSLNSTYPQGDWFFDFGDYNSDNKLDLYAIKGTNGFINDKYISKTNLMILSGTNYQDVLLGQTDTVLELTNDKFSFDLETLKGDRVADIWAIAKTGTQSGRVEVHTISGRNTNKFLINKPTGINALTANDNFSFDMKDYDRDGINDLWAIKRSHTSEGKTEVHIYSGATDFKKQEEGGISWHFVTSMNEAQMDFSFAVGDYDKDGYQDLWAIKNRNTGSGKTEVHIFSGKYGFRNNNDGGQSYHFATNIAETPGGWNFGITDYNQDGVLDIVMIKRDNTSTGKTEVHIYSGKEGFRSGSNGGKSYHIITPRDVTPVDEDWDFVLGDYDLDGRDDLYIIKKKGNSNTTEAHVLLANGSFSTYGNHLTTTLHTTNENWDFAGTDMSKESVYQTAE